VEATESGNLSSVMLACTDNAEELHFSVLQSSASQVPVYFDGPSNYTISSVSSYPISDIGANLLS
jgi:hypothetical protein